MMLSGRVASCMCRKILLITGLVLVQMMACGSSLRVQQLWFLSASEWAENARVNVRNAGHTLDASELFTHIECSSTTCQRLQHLETQAQQTLLYFITILYLIPNVSIFNFCTSGFYSPWFLFLFLFHYGPWQLMLEVGSVIVSKANITINIPAEKPICYQNTRATKCWC